MSILGIGIDIVEINRIKKILKENFELKKKLENKRESKKI